MLILETLQVASGLLPVDFATSNAGARTGDFVSLRHYRRLAILLFKDGGTAGEDVTLTIEQAKDAAGTAIKPLLFDTIYRKQGSDLATVNSWTRTRQTAANTYTNTTSAEDELIWVVEIPAESLDSSNGYTHVRGSVNDVGTGAQLGCVLYLLSEPRYAADPEQMMSGIA
ncbi:hypothetical protein [Tuwongella immobilis]|uniref:Uncharacterized protein n=1 Tax=Tuwongella immobilis TaxID=692036 RepID=A0A6C2YHE7_9BACT|nr:hypothetical protein [Tuwongella immobilis]VIP00689.1 Uncharacterized protein OS=Bradyrhizobium sp. YR681 GN=PMI42_04857 PE=4 SV=1 [Tuwongella immobilis]VTR96796.1 Uncharacterized protein OS=Bradyrhizobium sp. YR681 GN=PMI42_04857 PE=4 SV=1 [Tuwongella immobilis]